MPDFDDVVRMASEWDRVSESLSYGTPALKVADKSFCRLWGDRDFRNFPDLQSDVLVVFCTLEQKQEFLDESDGSVFVTPHYDGYGAVLIKLADVREADLRVLLRNSYEQRAPQPRTKRAPRK